jgi:predicted RNase H-like HicB family nuclease
MTDAERYAITVRKTIVEGEELWRATVRELPDLAEYAETRDEAIELALDAIGGLQSAAQEEGRAFPEPFEDEQEYSGRVTLRMPKSLHRAVALNALADDMSVNSYIVTTLAVTLSQYVRAAREPQAGDYQLCVNRFDWTPYLPGGAFSQIVFGAASIGAESATQVVGGAVGFGSLTTVPLGNVVPDHDIKRIAHIASPARVQSTQRRRA